MDEGISKDALDAIALPREVTPTCANCPFHATDPLQRQSPRQCRAEPPKLFMLPGPPDQLGRQQLQIVSAWPNDPQGPCGAHPLIKARAQVAYDRERERLNDR